MCKASSYPLWLYSLGFVCGQLTAVFTKSEQIQVPLLDWSAPFMDEIGATKEGVSKGVLKPSKALGPDELHLEP